MQKKIYSRLRFLFIVTVITVFSIYRSYGQTDTVNVFDMSLEELMNIKVFVGSNVMKDVRKQPISITTITKEQLELSGATTLIEAISIYVPGFFVVEDQDDVIVGTRGLAPDNNSKVMLLINGTNLNTEFFWGPPSAILNNINYDYIERVEVIRGPGSVILGQGALLGVINIITKNGYNFNSGKVAEGNVKGFYGPHNFMGGNVDLAINKKDFHSFVTLAYNNFDGQDFRREGWAVDKPNKGYKGGSVIDIGTKLKQSENINLFANAEYKGFSLNMMYFDHTKDLYNFYRDRNVFRQSLAVAALSYKHDFSEKISATVSGDFADDDFGLYSIDNYVMGGTKEQRAGGKMIWNFQEVVKSNFLAVGAEYKFFAMGKENREGYNFINNVVNSEVLNDYDNYLSTANDIRTMGYKSNLSVYSFFIEDFQKFGEHFDVFGALRYDNHPYWGAHISPRVGFIASVNKSLRLRLMYQEGFRGAVGIHYAGGYKMDGFLSAYNYSLIEQTPVLHFDENGNQIGQYANIPEAKPEQMKSYEFTVDYDFKDKINLTAVFFYNIVQNVFDVGVIWENSSFYTVPSIGTDVPGDWNGYWYYKNTEGDLKQYGTEINLTYKDKYFFANLSHSLVKIHEVSDQQLGSMYVTSENQFKAFPENVTRFNLIASATADLKIGLNYMYYFSWFSPTNKEVPGNHLVNLSAKYTLKKKLSARISVANLLGQTELYPMNSNVGDTQLSGGASTVLNTTFWLTLGYKF